MTINVSSGSGRSEAYERLLRQERLILDVTEALAGALEDSGVTRAELAQRLGRTPSFVSEVLDGGDNLTLRTIADIAGALSIQPSFELPGVTRSYVHAASDRAGVPIGSTGHDRPGEAGPRMKTVPISCDTKLPPATKESADGWRTRRRG